MTIGNINALLLLLNVALVTAAPSMPVKDGKGPSPRVRTAAHVESAGHVPDELRWEPWWREPRDCGPLALFALMRLQDKQVALKDVKGLIHLDPKRGCPLRDLQEAAEELGMAVESRFVRPSELTKMPCPYIVHVLSSVEKNVGHFDVILAYDSKQEKFATIDTTMARVGWVPEASLTRGYSGYVLVPKAPLRRELAGWSGLGLLLVGCTILSYWVYGALRRGRHAGT